MRGIVFLAPLLLVGLAGIGLSQHVVEHFAHKPLLGFGQALHLFELLLDRKD